MMSDWDGWLRCGVRVCTYHALSCNEDRYMVMGA